MAVGHGGPDQGFLAQDVAHQGTVAELPRGHHPQVRARQPAPGQGRQPILRDMGHGGLGLALAEIAGIEGPRKGPGHELGVHLPAQAPAAQVHAQVRAVGIGGRQVVIPQQGRHMLAAGRALARIAQHDEMGDGQRRRHRLGRAGVDLVVQPHPVGVGCRKKGGRIHG